MLAGCGAQPFLLARWSPFASASGAPIAEGDLLVGVVDLAGLMAKGGGNLVGANGASLVPVGGGNIVATSGAGLVPLGGGNIVATNGAGLAPDSPAGYKVLALDAFGAPINASANAVTGADGSFRVPAARGRTTVVEAAFEGVFLSSLVPGDRPATLPLRLSSATTIATEYLRAVFRTDKARLAAITHVQFEDLVSRVGALAASFDGPLELPSATVAVEAFEVLRTSTAGDGLDDSATTVVTTMKAAPTSWPAGKPTLVPTAAMVGDVIAIGNIPAPPQGGEEFLAVAFNGSKVKAKAVREGTTLRVTVPADAKTGPIVVLSNSTPAATPQFEVMPLAGELDAYPVPFRPSAMAFAGDRRLWIASTGENTLVALDGAGREVARQAFEARPLGALWADREGGLWATRGSELLRLDATTGATISTTKLPLGTLSGAAMTPDGHLWVPDAAKAEVARFDRAGKLIAAYKAGRGPRALAVTPAGQVWVANEADGTIQGFDGQGGPLGVIAVDTLPHVIAAGPDGAIWVGHRASRSVWRVKPGGEHIAVVGWTEDIQAIQVDGRGTAWVGVSAGVTRVWPDGRKAGLVPGPSLAAVDAAGYLWQPSADGFSVRKLRPN